MRVGQIVTLKKNTSRRLRVIKKPGRGYRCKYCDCILSDLRYEAERKKR